VRVTASCSSPPTSLCLDFWRHDALHNRSEKISPADRADIRWMATSWRAELRAELEDRITARIHRHNKYVALWHARVLIRGWTRGLSASEADSGGGAGWAYVGTEAVSMALMLLGDSK
jgi:hypothetical protein